MAWCENENCGKTGLRKADVELDDNHKKIYCHGCYALVHPGWVPPAEYVDLSGGFPQAHELTPSRLGIAFQMNEADGLKAMFSYGGISLAVQATHEDLKRFFG